MKEETKERTSGERYGKMRYMSISNDLCKHGPVCPDDIALLMSRVVNAEMKGKTLVPTDIVHDIDMAMFRVESMSRNVLLLRDRADRTLGRSTNAHLHNISLAELKKKIAELELVHTLSRIGRLSETTSRGADVSLILPTLSWRPGDMSDE